MWSACLFLLSVLSSGISSLGNNEFDSYEVLLLSELKTLRRDVEELQHVVNGQEREIQSLKRTNERQQEQLGMFADYSSHIEGLESKVLALEEECKTSFNVLQDRNNSLDRKERFLADSSPATQPTPSSDIIAFYAYMSQAEINPGAHHTLTFDTVKTNEGGAYSPNTGVFTSPRDGIYVFIWKIRMYQAEHSTELVVNQDVYGATFLRSKNGDDGSVTGVVVAHLSQGDEVFVRTHSAFAGDGNIHSNQHGYPSFSGWKLN